MNKRRGIPWAKLQGDLDVPQVLGIRFPVIYLLGIRFPATPILKIHKIISFSDSPKDFQNCRFSLQLNLFGCGNTSGDMVQSFWKNMDFGRCFKTRVMTLSVLCVGPQFPNMQNFDACEGIWRYIKLLGSISPVCQYWKNRFFLCPTMEADMEALGAAYSIFHHSNASSFHAGFSWTPTRRYLKI